MGKTQDAALQTAEDAGFVTGAIVTLAAVVAGVIFILGNTK